MLDTSTKMQRPMSNSFRTLVPKGVTLCLLTFLLLAFGVATAQTGVNDPTFNPIPFGSDPGWGANARVSTLTMLPGGDVFIGGAFTQYDGIGRNRLARLHADGSLDYGFDPGTGVNDTVLTSAVQADGKVIMGGKFTMYNGSTCNRITRLNSDGSLDAGFVPGTGANAAIYAAILQGDGKILIGGTFTTYDGTSRNRIARLNADGSLDPSFDPGTGSNDTIRSITVQTDGKLIIGGNFTSYNNIARYHVARLNVNGTLDGSFTPVTLPQGPDGMIYCTAVQADGKIIIGGECTIYASWPNQFMARMNSNGSLDTSFDMGTGPDATVRTIALQADGKILIGGAFISYNGIASGFIARIHADGSRDPVFDTSIGAVLQDYTIGNGVHAIGLGSNGQVILGGEYAEYDFIARNNLARIDADAKLDGSFDPIIGVNNLVFCTAVQADGKILIGGDFTYVNGSGRGRIARLNVDGSVDTSFATGQGANNLVRTIHIQPDGKILITGGFGMIDGILRASVARLNFDGSLDTSFDPGSGSTDWVTCSALQTDGKLLIGGVFESFNGIPSIGIARLDPDGNVDPGFNVGGEFYGGTETIVIQPDGKILVGGPFGYGSPHAGIERLNMDGSLDSSFDPGSGVYGTLHSIALQTDGKIMIAGNFTQFNGIPRSSIARLNADGSLDTSFDPGTGLVINWDIFSMLVQADGDVLIGGDFATYNGSVVHGLARLHANGILADAFGTGAAVSDHWVIVPAVFCIVHDAANENILIGGSFNTFDGVVRNHITRIGEGQSVSTGDMEASIANALYIWPNPNTGDHVFLSLADAGPGISSMDVKLFDAMGHEVFMKTLPAMETSPCLLDLGDAANGVYLLQIVANGKTYQQRVVVDR